MAILMLPLPSLSAQEIHPILVNFTAALIPASLASDMLGKILRKQSLTHAAWWMLVYAATITPFTVMAGWYWKRSVEAILPPGTIAVHQWLGTSLAVLFLILAGWRFDIHRKDQAPSVSYFMLAVLVVAALVYQGSLGGKMVFSKTFVPAFLCVPKTVEVRESYRRSFADKSSLEAGQACKFWRSEGDDAEIAANAPKTSLGRKDTIKMKGESSRLTRRAFIGSSSMVVATAGMYTLQKHKRGLKRCTSTSADRCSSRLSLGQLGVGRSIVSSR